MAFEMIYFIIFAWLICGVLFWGMWFAYFQGKFPEIADEDYRENLGLAVFFGLIFGPLGLFVWFFLPKTIRMPSSFFSAY